MEIKVKREDDWRGGYFSAGNHPGRPWYTDLRSGELPTTRVPVDKSTHRIRFEDETESSVVIVIEPKEGA